MAASALLILPLLGAPALQGVGDVVLLRQAGIAAFEDVTEGFTENCRVRVRQVPLEEDGYLLRRIGAAQLVVAIGQAAAEAAARSGVQVVYALAPTPPPGAIGSDSSAPPELVLRAMLEARPGLRRIGVLHGPRTQPSRLQQARAAARALGVELLERPAGGGPQAIQALRDLAGGQPPAQALWIGLDLGLVTTPVFQYALQLQLGSGIPIIAATRQQVRSGAFLAVDWPPRLVGRRLAAQVNLALQGAANLELAGREDPAGAPQVTLNGVIARKLGVDVAARRAAGWRIE